MQIPNLVKILGHEYTIEEVNSNDIQGANGETWLKKHRILLDKDIPQSRKESVLLHEIIEVINSQFELEMDHSKIECLEETLYATLKENKLHY